MSRHFDLLRREDNVSRSFILPSEEVAMEIGGPVTSGRAYGGGNGKDLDVLSFLYTLKKRWRISVLIGSVVLVAVIAITFLETPIYEPVAKLEVDPPGAEAFSLQSGSSGNNDPEYAETQAQNLQSDSLASETIRALGWTPQQGASVKQLSDAQIQGSFEQQAQSAAPPVNANVLRAFKARLHVKRDSSSRLILVSFEDKDAADAALVTNSLIRLFADKTQRIRYEAIIEASAWLSRQLEDIKEKAAKSSQKLADYERSHDIVAMDGTQNSVDQKVVDLSHQLTDAQSSRIQLQASMSRIQAGNGDALPQVRNNQTLQGLTQKLIESRANLSQAMAFYGENNPAVQKLRGEVQELTTQLDQQKHEAQREIEQSFSAARTRENLVRNAMKQATSEMSQVAEYGDIRREAETDRNLYNTLYTRIKEAGIAAGSKSNNVHLVDEARILDKPTKPNRLLAACAGLLFGVIGGVIGGFLSEQMDSRISSLSEIRNLKGISSASSLPLQGEKLKKGRGTELEPSEIKLFLESPFSPQAEALRILKTSTMLSRPMDRPRTLLVVSPSAKEGKTTVAVNLAMGLAQHERTCLIDADLRKVSGVSHRFQLSGRLGLTDLLSGTVSYEHALAEIAGSKLTILPAGSEVTNPTELILSAAMQRLIARLQESFSYVVIDSPPLLPFADARALLPLVRRVILVIRSNVTTRPAMDRTLELISQFRHGASVDIVLNGAEPNVQDHHYYGLDYQAS